MARAFLEERAECFLPEVAAFQVLVPCLLWHQLINQPADVLQLKGKCIFQRFGFHPGLPSQGQVRKGLGVQLPGREEQALLLEQVGSWWSLPSKGQRQSFLSHIVFLEESAKRLRDLIEYAWVFSRPLLELPFHAEKAIFYSYRTPNGFL